MLDSTSVFVLATLEMLKQGKEGGRREADWRSFG